MMAITCRVYEPVAGGIEATTGGFLERRTCVFFSDTGEIAGTDWSEIEVQYLHTDTLATARGRIVTAAVARGAEIGYEVARSRVIFPDINRGS